MSVELTSDPLHIVIVGAGVIGLSIAHVLSTHYPSYRITIVARDFPDEAGLLSQAWASPWAVCIRLRFSHYEHHDETARHSFRVQIGPR
jgi:glycine/D-amino acid oxidase-like deaminating enzyme